MKNKNLEKIILISYFYPPCNFTASRRVLSWSNDFNKYSFYPIVITRNWDVLPKNFEQLSYPSGNSVKVEESNIKTVYYLPHKQTLRDKIISKYGMHGFVFLRKLLSISQIILNLFFISKNYSHLYKQAKSLLNSNSSINKVILSGGPFESFLIGYKLKKEYQKLKIIYDFRDLWTLNPFYPHKGIIKYLQKKYEKKWIKSASLVLCVEKTASLILSQQYGIKTKVIANGFEKIDNTTKKINANKNVLTIIHAGTFFYNYNTTLLEKGLKAFVLSQKVKVKLLFLGAAVENINEKKIKSLSSHPLIELEITERVNHLSAIEEMKKSDILLIFSLTKKETHMPSSKLYQYLALKKPILLTPSDESIIEEILNDTGLGIICNTVKEITDFLTTTYLRKQKGENLLKGYNESSLKTYSREMQSKKLSEILQEI